jgi:hypothetical protein
VISKLFYHSCQLKFAVFTYEIIRSNSDNIGTNIGGFIIRRWGIFILIILGILSPAFFVKKKISPPVELPQYQAENWEKKLQTGDILLWANNSIDSLVVQELTDGPYSHTALIHRHRDGKIWVMDTYPEAGLRYMPIDEYLNPKEFKLTRVGIMRFRGKIDLPLMEEYIHQLLKNQHQISFDNALIFDDSRFELETLKNQAYPLYCTEIIYQIMRHCTVSTDLYVNDYDRIMHKWETLSAQTKGKKLSPLQFIKLFYLKLNLKKLKESTLKILITPNGMRRSPSFEMIYEVELLEDAHDLRKVLIETPEYSESPPSSEVP